MLRPIHVLAILGLLALLGPGSPALAQEGPAPDSTLQEERMRRIDWEHLKNPPEDRSTDLWYGTPGIRAGGDMIGPLLDLIRHPAAFLNFRPRPVPRTLPDRETVEFLRERK